MAVRFLVKSDDRDHKESAMLGLLTTFAIADKNKLKSMTIVVPSMESFDHAKLGKVIDGLKIKGISASKLRSHESVNIKGVEITAITFSQISSQSHIDVLVVYAPTSNELETIDNLDQIGHVVYAPWSATEEIEWGDKWGPVLV